MYICIYVYMYIYIYKMSLFYQLFESIVNTILDIFHSVRDSIVFILFDSAGTTVTKISTENDHFIPSQSYLTALMSIFPSMYYQVNELKHKLCLISSNLLSHY